MPSKQNAYRFITSSLELIPGKAESALWVTSLATESLAREHQMFLFHL